MVSLPNHDSSTIKGRQSASDQTRTIQDLKDMVREFCEKRDWDQFHNPKELAIGIATEAGELLQLFRFKDETQMQEMLEEEKAKQKIRDELADVLYFTLRFAQLYDIDLYETLSEKLQQNEKKYPQDKVRGKNKKYDEY